MRTAIYSEMTQRNNVNVNHSSDSNDNMHVCVCIDVHLSCSISNTIKAFGIVEYRGGWESFVPLLPLPLKFGIFSKEN